MPQSSTLYVGMVDGNHQCDLGHVSKITTVHTDFSIHFDGNTYTVPPWLISTSVTVKADHHHLTCYFKDKAVATHLRCWQRKQRIELPQHREAAEYRKRP